MKVRYEVYSVAMQYALAQQEGLIFVPETSSIELVKEYYEFAEKNSTYKRMGEILADQEFFDNDEFEECNSPEEPEKRWYEYLH